MVRIARLVIPDVPHHITQRGNNRQDVFFVDQDRWVYLNLLAEECAAAAVEGPAAPVIRGACLIPKCYFDNS